MSLKSKGIELLKKVFLSILCCFLGWTLIAQRSEVLFRGRVTDASTGEPLPFCHLYNLNLNQTYFSDVSGYFSFRMSINDSVQISYIGYQTKVMGYFSIIDLSEVKLEPLSTPLQSVVVRPGVNPAHRIIENAVRNRHQNNPEKSDSYQCFLYHKMVLNVEESIDFPQRLPRTKHPLLKPDTSSYSIVLESVVSRTFMAPDHIEEQVVASKTSGFSEYQQLSVALSSLQFFHFYDDLIEWKNINQSYLNPISPNSINRYFFLLQNINVSEGGDSTFVISFQPSRVSNIDGLKGVLYINSNGWAIEYVVAEPATAALFPIKIQQQYRLIDDTTWFPSEMSFEASYNNLALTGLNISCYSKSTISNVVLNPDLNGRKMAAKTISIAQDAAKRSGYIERYRSSPLTQKELNTYQKYEHSNFDWVMQMAEGVIDQNSLSFNVFEIPFSQVLNYNYFEGWRLGLGIFSNRRLSPFFSAGGYYRYGQRDQKSKFGASFSFFPNKDRDTEIKVWFQNDWAGLSYCREAGILGSAWLKNVHLGIKYNIQEFAPVFEYSFKEILYDQYNRLNNNEIAIMLRYTIHEQRTKLFRRTYSLRSDYPVFYLRYAFGFSSLFQSDYHYQRVELGVEFNRFFRNFGRTYFSLWGGGVSNHIPVLMIFNQSYLSRTIFFGEDSKSKFNVISNQIYASNGYVHCFLYHDFGSLLWKMKSNWFRPRFAIAQSAGCSWLSNLEEHGGTPLMDMSRGYFESGVVVEDIIRLNYLNLFYFGFGGALYGAFGGSVATSLVQTFSPMIRLSISF